ncbi:uncharacterized protein VP01_7200g1, partial [Puccinia sorghi]
DFIAADVVGPYKKSVDGCQFVVTVQDIASGLVLAIPLKTKREAPREIVWWMGQFVTQGKWPVKCLRMDNALEFVSRIGDFRLGDALDGQDAAVKLMESRDPYRLDSPSYEEAVRSGDADDWKAAMKEEISSLDQHQVHVKEDPPKDKKKLLCSRWLLGTKRTMQGALCWRKARIIRRRFCVQGGCWVPSAQFRVLFAGGRHGLLWVETSS